MADARRILLASDHAGRTLRAVLCAHARHLGYVTDDLGPAASDADGQPAQQISDYPDAAAALCRQLRGHDGALGILICGTGIGMSLAANALPGIRAALCTSEYMARMARAHNDANVLCLGERILGGGAACAILEAFLTEPFAGGRHVGRLAKLAALRTCV